MNATRLFRQSCRAAPRPARFASSGPQFARPTRVARQGAVVVLRVAAAGAAGVAAYVLTKPVHAEMADRFGMYVWGDNEKHVAAPGISDRVVKTPRELPFFHGMALRDVALGDDFGAAVTEHGDIVQWGDGYGPSPVPAVVLAGKQIGRVVISHGRLYAVTQKGDRIYSIPGTAREQAATPQERWFPFFGKAPAFPTLDVPLARAETVAQVAAGESHLLVLTSKGRVFSCVTGTQPALATDGQLGVPVFGELAAEQVHEIATLRGVNVVQVAAGDAHSVVRDDKGRVWSFGANSHGQLGVDYTLETAYVPIPSAVPLDRLYNAKGLADVSCEYVAAGGNTTLFAVRNRKKGVADLWVSGSGLQGQHGTGRFLHMQGTPVRVKALSGMTEYSERQGKLVEIPVRYVSVGKQHIAAVLDNAAGKEFMIWGGNSVCQLGNGRRSNLPRPEHMHTSVSGEFANTRRQLESGTINGKPVEEAVVCGNYASALYWRCK